MNGQPETSGLRAFQTAFAARLRDPQGASLPEGTPERRMRAYEGLVFHNLQGFLNACYPVTRSIVGAAAWERAARRFLAEHRCTSPLFRDIPGEFLDWCGETPTAPFPDQPFLPDLMHYEWLELAVEVAADESPTAAIDPWGDLLSGEPVWNPAARLACYRYPVHRISPGYQPVQLEPQPACYLLYRDADARVRFVLLTPVSARLAELLREGGMTGRGALLQIAAEMGLDPAAGLFEGGRVQLEAFREVGVVTGVRSNP